MKLFRFSSLRVRLQMLVWVAIIPILLLIVSENMLDRSHKEAELREYAVGLVNLAEGSLEQYINNTRPLLLVISHSDVIQKGEPASISVFLRDMLQHYPEYANFGVADLEGNVLGSAVPLKKPVNSSDLLWFRQTLKSRDFTVGEYQIGRITGIEVIVFGQPVFDRAGKMKFVLFASMDLKWLNRLWKNIKLLPDSTFTVTDNSGTVLFRYPLVGGFVGKNMAHVPIVKVMLTKVKGITEADGLDNKNRIYAFTTTGMPGSKIHMAVGVSKKAALKPISNILVISLIVLALVAALGLYLARLYSNRFILNPINALQDAAGRFTSGDYTGRINLTDGENELIAFTNIFDKMAETIETKSKDLRLFRELIDRTNDAIFIADTETGFILDVNKKACTSTGYSRDELLNMHVMNVDAIKTEYSLWKEHTEEVREKGGVIFESMHKRKNGTTFPVELNVKYLAVDDHSYIIGIARDITERKKTEDKLKALLLQQASVSELSQSALARTDLSALMNEATKLVVHALDVEYSKVLELLPDGSAFLLRFGVGWKDGLVGQATVDAGVESQAGFTLLASEPVIVEDFHAETRFSTPPLLSDHGVVSGISVIIQGRDRPFGVLGAHTTRLRTFTRDDINFIQSIANILTATIEREKTEELLRENNYRLNTILQSSPAAIITMNPEGVVTAWNKAAEQIFGWTEEETMGKINPIVTEDKLEEFQATRKRVMSGESLFNIETQGQRKDGQRIDVSFSVAPMFDGKDNIIGIIALALDITSRKKSEALIINILESVDEGFIIIDPEYRIISANRAYCEQVKSPDCDIIGRHCYEVSHHLEEPCFMADEECAPRHTFKTGVPYTALHTHYDRDNNPVYVETKSYAIKDSFGQVTAVIETQNNITERRKLEEQLRHTQKMEAIGTLVGGIAHDFNNMLNIIIGYADIIQMHLKPDDPQWAQLKEILTAGDRAAQLTRGLLAFSRKQVMEIKTVNLNEIVEGFKKMLARIIGEDIDLKITLSERDLTAKTDIVQIEQVLMNLAVNAKDAMPHGGALTIETSSVKIDREFIRIHGYGEPGRYALIIVSDTGTGMDEKTRERIFEPYFTTKEMGKGTGLGLAIVYGIVTQHNGYIHCYSEPGKGTTFRIYIPLVKAVAEKIEIIEEETITPKGGTETILVAEDDANVRGLIKHILEGFGYTVIEAVDGSDAVEKFKSNKDKIKLLLTDLIMPKKNGKDAYEDIKSIRHDIRVIFISGYARDIIQRFGLEEGIEFISKPVLPRELLRKVREELDK